MHGYVEECGWGGGLMHGYVEEFEFIKIHDHDDKTRYIRIINALIIIINFCNCYCGYLV